MLSKSFNDCPPELVEGSFTTLRQAQGDLRNPFFCLHLILCVSVPTQSCRQAGFPLYGFKRTLSITKKANYIHGNTVIQKEKPKNKNSHPKGS